MEDKMLEDNMLEDKISEVKISEKNIMEDTTDISWFSRKKNKKPSGEDTNKIPESTAPPSLTATPPQSQRAPLISRPTNEEFYNNDHPRNGIALVLNHKYVKGMKPRGGTEKDCESIVATLLLFGFEVRVHNELTHKQVQAELRAVAAEDHSQNDCFVLVIMTHGEEGQVCASDTSYPVEELWQPFLGENCKSLIDKPKIFFVQACRGKKVDNPVKFQSLQVRTAFEAPLMPIRLATNITYAIPSTADMLVMYATFDKHFSFRNVDYGSWFIQSLSSVLKEAAKHKETLIEGVELLKLLTAVNRKVAYEYQSYSLLEVLNEKKEMPNFMSTLTKTFYLKVKPRVGASSGTEATLVPVKFENETVKKTETDSVQEFFKKAKAEKLMYC